MTISSTRDEIMAEDVAAMAALGKFEKEFTVYGCAFWENNQVVFALSEKLGKIYEWMNSPVNADKFVTSMHRATIRSLVPAGMEEQLLKLVRQRLVTELQGCYSAEYFQSLERISTVMPTDQSAALLQSLCFTLDGVCNEEQLLLYRGLLERAYNRKVLLPETYYSLMEWIRWTQRDLDAFQRQMDQYEKTFYGFAYLNSSDQNVRVFLDGNKANAYEKLEKRRKDGYCVSNIVDKTWWYNNQYSIVDAKKDCQSYFENLFDNTYIKALLEIGKMETPLRRDLFVKVLDTYRHNKQTAMIESMERQAKIWWI